MARALVKDTWIYIKIGDVEVRVGWDDEVFTQTDGAKLEASAPVWQFSLKEINEKIIMIRSKFCGLFD